MRLPKEQATLNFAIDLILILVWALVAMGLFAMAYYLAYVKVQNAFCLPTCGSEPYTLLDFFYFSVVTWNSLGYGDFAPAMTLTRCLATLESLAGVAVFVFLVALASFFRAKLL